MTEEKRLCDGCGYRFAEKETPSAMFNYGNGAGPHYWCRKCFTPVKSAEEAAKIMNKFMEDVS